MRPDACTRRKSQSARKESSHGGERHEAANAPRLFRDPARRPGRLLAQPRPAFPHKDRKGFNIVLQAFPLDGKIVCREVGDDDHTAEADRRSEHGGRDDRQQRRGGTSRS